MNAHPRRPSPFLWILLLAALLWCTGDDAHAQTRLYVGQTLGDLTANCIISDFDASTGAVINSKVLEGPAQVQCMAVSGNVLLLGLGPVSTAGGGICEYDANTGALVTDSFLPGPRQAVRSILIVRNDVFVVFGDLFDSLPSAVAKYDISGALIAANFIADGPTGRSGLAASANSLFVLDSLGKVGKYDLQTGEGNSSFINAVRNPPGSTPSALAIVGNNLSVARTYYDGTIVETLVDTYDASTGALLSTLTLRNNNFYSLSGFAASGNSLFVPGTFITTGFNPGSCISQYDANTGDLINAIFNAGPEEVFPDQMVVASAPIAPNVEQLTATDVAQIVAQAATAASQSDPRAIIAVTDREGFLLALWDVSGQIQGPLAPFPVTGGAPGPFPTLSLPLFRLYSFVGGAVTRASTAAFLSSNQEAFTSRTAGYIIQQHFPVGIRDTANGPLVGVGLSSLFFSDVNRVKLIPPGFDGSVSDTESPGVRAPLLVPTTLNDSPGGVPLYKNGKLVGGLGVTGDGSPTNLAPAGAIVFKESQTNFTSGFKAGHDTDEDVALAGQTGFRPPNGIRATNVLINGIRLPYVYPTDVQDIQDVRPLGSMGHAVDITVTAPAPQPVASGFPQASPAPYPYEQSSLGDNPGEIRYPIRGDPLLAVPGRTLVGGKAGRLTASEVTSILSNAAAQAGKTRAGIRLPLGTPSENFIAVVNNPEKGGEAPAILGVYRTGEATIFSWDVAVQKARTSVFFSNSQLAMSTRTVGFMAQRFFPPGIDGNPPGPFFGFQEAVSLKRNQSGFFPGDPNLPNGITIFPGGFPLYRHGQLIGAIGVSGDGVDQDDIIAAAGTVGFLAPNLIRADHYSYHGARLPYAKFPRDPDIDD